MRSLFSLRVQCVDEDQEDGTLIKVVFSYGRVILVANCIIFIQVVAHFKGALLDLGGIEWPSGQGMGSWLACREFEPSTTEDPPCRAAMHLTSYGTKIDKLDYYPDAVTENVTHYVKFRNMGNGNIFRSKEFA
ncbi:UNVERIFIED_CONTAM: hypothetical protein NCL1_04017 [Trichonephila clavipes]